MFILAFCDMRNYAGIVFFECNDGNVLHPALVCDGVESCENGEDEAKCPMLGI